MANSDNLRKLTTEEARKIGKKGGIASAKARQERKTLKEELLLLLENEDIQKKISVALIERAMIYDSMGNKAFEVIRDTIGEKPKEEIGVTGQLTYEQALKKVSGNDEY